VALFLVLLILFGVPALLLLCLAPFVLIGLYLAVGRFAIDAARRARTSYGVSNERAIIISGLVQRRTESIDLRTLTEVSLTERSDRSGTVTFGHAHPLILWFAAFPGWPGTAGFVLPRFEGISNAREVYDIIRRVQRQRA